MKSIKGPAIYLAQFVGDQAPFNTFDSICGWASSLGFKGVQIPAWDARLIDIQKAAESRTYCDDLKGAASRHSVEITELASHLQGQLVAVHPAYDVGLVAFAVPQVRGNPEARQKWAVEQVMLCARASRNLGLDAHVTFPGALAWPYLYPWPPRPTDLIATAFGELAHRWKPILDAHEDVGVDVCFELHPGEDLFDGTTFERFLALVDDHPRAKILYDPSHMLLQHMDYLGFIERYHPRIAAFHVKDAEFTKSARSGVYGGYAGWIDRPGRFRSVGDGDIDFRGVFERLTRYGIGGWAVLEWECCLKNPLDGAAEGARFIAEHIIRVAGRPFDAGLRTAPPPETLDRMLGLDR